MEKKRPMMIFCAQAPSWRDRMAGMVGPSRSVLTKNLKPKVTVSKTNKQKQILK